MSQARPFSVYFDEKRVTILLTPIEREVRVVESAIGFESDIEEFAEIVKVQLEQVRQDRLLLGRCRDELNLSGWLVVRLGHRGSFLLRV